MLGEVPAEKLLQYEKTINSFNDYKCLIVPFSIGEVLRVGRVKHTVEKLIIS